MEECQKLYENESWINLLCKYLKQIFILFLYEIQIYVLYYQIKWNV